MAANPSHRAFTPEIYSDYVKMFFKQNLVAASHFTDFSNDVAGEGDTIYIPGIAELDSVTTLTQSTGALTDRYVADTRTALKVNTWEAFSLRFTDFQLAQISNSVGVQKRYAEAIAHNLAKTFDTALLAEAKSGLIARIGDSSSMTTTKCRQAMEICDSYSIPRNELLWIMGHKSYWDLMRRSAIYDASVFGGGNAPMATGKVGTLFGVPVTITTQVPQQIVGIDETNFLVHPRTVAYAFANIDGTMSGPRIQLVQGDGLYKRLVGDLAYGVKILDSTGGVKVYAMPK
jgi:hypothetical protein